MLIEAKGLVKCYRTKTGMVSVLEDLAFGLPEGGSLALTGPSGSGKSTLLNILCGLEPFDRGQLRVLGADAGTLSADDWAGLRRQRIGMVFQDSNLMPALTLVENARLRADLAEVSFGPVSDWLARLGLAGLENRYPDQVSGGQRQRAALATVFAMGPRLILADEPTGSLDRHTAHAVAELLFQWQQRSGCGLLLATHDPALAAQCDDTLDLSGGD